MRYALISDIHANLPALRSVYADIQRQADVGAVYHLGDLVGYAPWPNEVVAMIAAAGTAGVAGNYDSTVATDYKHCGCRYEDPRQEELSHVSYDWTRRQVACRSASTCCRRAAISPGHGSCWFMARRPSTRCIGPRIAPMSSASRWRVMRG